jgi:predicted RNA-binding Zn-ribbon protein involved in translation (DUF1610 family)
VTAFVSPEALAAAREAMNADEGAVFFTRSRTARRERQCAACLRPIRVGQRYEVHSCPPGGDPSAPDAGWQTTAAHMPYDCDWGAES